MSDLAPCPFCGYSHEKTQSAYDSGWYSVRCEICHAYGPSNRESNAKAEADWNRRATGGKESGHE